MKLIKDWDRVLILSMSFWSQVLGLIVLIAPEVLYSFTGIDTDPVLLWWVGTLLLLFGLAGRLVRQQSKVWVEWIRIIAVFVIIILLALFASKQAHASEREGAALDVAVPLIAKWEGLRLEAYFDLVGVATICYGSTRGVKIGMTKTKYECDLLLKGEVMEYRKKWLVYVKPQAYQNWLPPPRDAAYTSLAYNVGIHGAGKSTATRRLNAGDIKGGCAAIGWWNRAGGRVIRGLSNRRSEETQLCLIEGAKQC